MRPYPLLFTASVASLFLALSSHAAVIYDNGQPVSDPASLCSPVCPELIRSTGHGVFTLVSDATLTGVRFWTFQASDVYNGETLTWQVFENNGGTHGALIGSGWFTLSQILVGPVSVFGLDLDEFENNFAVPSLQINPSASPQAYFLDISDATSNASAGIFWANSGYDTLAFELSGTGNIPAIPEPATIMLLAAGMAGCAAGRFLKRAIRLAESRTKAQR